MKQDTPHLRCRRAGDRTALRTKLLLAVLFLAALTHCSKKTPPPASPGFISGVQTGIASWYGHPFHGRRTANGEVYDMDGETAAHRSLPFNTIVRVDNLDNNKQTTVRINDRGPFVKGRIIDLSRKAAREIDMIGPGTARVRVTIVGRTARVRDQAYTVQVGSFRSQANAAKLHSRLAARFGKVVTQSATVSGVRYFRVRVGRFEKYSQAKTFAKTLRRQPQVDSTKVVRVGS